MGRMLISTNSFNSVGANQRATLDLPVGKWKYHQIRLVYGTSTGGGPNRTNIEAELTRIAIAVNGKEQVVYTAAQLLRLHEFRGLVFHTGQVPLFLAQPWMATPPGQDALGWGTADVQTLQVTVDIGGATAPTLKALVVVEEKQEPMTAIAKIRRVTLPVTATGINIFTSLPKDDNIAALWLFPSATADITESRVLVDQKEVFRATTAEMQAFYEDGVFQWATPAGAFWPILFNWGGRVTEPLIVRGKSELKLELTMANANSVTALIEQYGLRD
jgi:hypothetical protein